jgi:hypothetical protein
MATIILNDEQVRLLSEASAPVVVRRPDGSTVGVLDPIDAVALAAAKRQAALRERCYTSEQVRAQMAALEAERARLGPAFTRTYMEQFLANLQAADPPKADWDGGR